MHIIKILNEIKGKVLDSSHFELLKHAYELQEQNLSQLKTNNAALKESNELLKEKSQSYIEEIDKLKTENESLSRLVESNRNKDDEAIRLSEGASKVFQRIINEDVTDFYQNAIVDVMDMSKIAVEAALDELSEHGLITASSARHGYGLHYFLTRKAKKALNES